MAKKKDPFTLPSWGGNDSVQNRGYANYEVEFLRLENEKLREQLESAGKGKMDKTMEKDIAALLQISMNMKYLLEQVRTQTMLPLELGRQIDRVIKEIENYG